MVVFALALVASPARGEEEESSLEDMTLEELLRVEVTSASLLPEDPWTAPALVYVFSEEMIAARGYTNLLELLEDVPGIQIQRRSQVDSVNAALVRGTGVALGNETFVIMLDGFRITPATGDFYVLVKQFSLAGARQVEVVLGPASALYGADTFGGVVNIVTRRGGETAGARIAASAGQYRTGEASFHAGSNVGALPVIGDAIGVDDIEIAVTGHIYHSDEPYFPDFYGDDFAWYRDQYRTSGLLRASPFADPSETVQVPIEPWATPSDSSFLHVRANLGDFELGVARYRESHSSSTGVRPEFTYYTRDAVLESSLDLLYAKHTYAPPGHRWNLSSSLWYQSTGSGPDSRFINSFSGYTEVWKYGTGSSTTLDERLTVDVADGVPLIAGVSVAQLASQADSADLPRRYDPDRPGPEQGLFYPGSDVVDANGRSLAIPQDFYAIDYGNIGAYLQLQVKRFRRFETSLGARYDVNTRYGGSFNPRASVVLKPSSSWRIKLIYGEAFLAAAPFKAFQHFGAFTPVTDASGAITGLRGEYWFLPNPDLAPETLRQGDAIVMWSAVEGLRFSVGGYLARIDDLIQPGPFETGVTFKGVPIDVVQRHVNQGSGTLYGATAQVEAGARAGRFDLRLTAAYAWTDGEVEDRSLTQSARHTGQVSATGATRLGAHTFTLTPRLLARGRAVSRAFDDAGNAIDSYTDPAATLDVFARWGLQLDDAARLSAFVRVENALDRRHYIAAESYPDTFGLAPQDPIRAVAGISFEHDLR